MADKPKFKRGQGPNALPWGGAKNLNDIAGDLTNLTEVSAAQAPDIKQLQIQLANNEITQEQYDNQIGQLQGQRIQAADIQQGNMAAELKQYLSQAPDVQKGFREDVPEGVQFTNEDVNIGALAQGEDRLYGTTARPNENIATGRTTTGLLPPPKDVYAWLPKLIDAASSPDAPAELHSLLSLLVYHLGS